jgi:hypothetical protein
VFDAAPTPWLSLGIHAVQIDAITRLAAANFALHVIGSFHAFIGIL